MYITVVMGFETGPNGEEEMYHIGADVDESYDNYGGRERWGGWEVSEPDISAPGSTLSESRATQATIDALPAGWSERFEERATELREIECKGPDDGPDADEFLGDYDNRMWEEESL